MKLNFTIRSEEERWALLNALVVARNAYEADQRAFAANGQPTLAGTFARQVVTIQALEDRIESIDLED